ncbi:hypothetical protein P3769_15460 [Pseudomonas aeruginosa]|nr:hypothetical protein [Pseudomonas aeruginosa]
MIGPRLEKANRVVTADYPDLERVLRSELEYEFSRGPVDLKEVRNLVSSPRLQSLYLRSFTHPDLVEAGGTFLDKHTMLADAPQKTFAVSSDRWRSIARHVVEVREFSPRDQSVMQVQLWPFDPRSLDDFAMVIAVALSYMPNELVEESRISLALGEMVGKWGYFTDTF